MTALATVPSDCSRLAAPTTVSSPASIAASTAIDDPELEASEPSLESTDTSGMGGKLRTSSPGDESSARANDGASMMARSATTPVSFMRAPARADGWPR